jgi:hypothetical protein
MSEERLGFWERLLNAFNRTKENTDIDLIATNTARQARGFKPVKSLAEAKGSQQEVETVKESEPKVTPPVSETVSEEVQSNTPPPSSAVPPSSIESQPSTPEPTSLPARDRSVAGDPLAYLTPSEKRRYNELTQSLIKLQPPQLSDRQVSQWETDIDVIRKKYGVPDEVYKDYINSINKAHEEYKQEVDTLRKLQVFNHILAAIGNVFIGRFAAAAKGPGIQAIDLSGEMQQASRNLNAKLTTEDKKLDVAKQRAQEERTLLNILQENERWNDAQRRYQDAQTESARKEAKQDAETELARWFNLGKERANQDWRMKEYEERLKDRAAITEANKRAAQEKEEKRRRENEANKLQSRSDKLVSDINTILKTKYSDEDDRLDAINTALTKSALPIPEDARINLTSRVGVWERITGPDKGRIHRELEQMLTKVIQPHINRVKAGEVTVIRFTKEGQPPMELPFDAYHQMSDKEREQIASDGWKVEFR